MRCLYAWSRLARPGSAPVGRHIWVALVAGLALLGGAVVVALSASPTVVVSTNSVAAETPLDETVSGGSVCQSAESLPPDISAIRLSLLAPVGPRLAVKIL